jgi:crotonobetainyl-CoA:carnitine CoA-transferase CaiB-like acyl-CoA transferase
MDPVPALGEHTDAILHELGIDAEGVRTLRAAEAI